MADFQTSLSAYQVVQRCEQKYSLQYVHKIRRREQRKAPTLGRILHDYIQVFSEQLKAGKNAEDAHVQGQFTISVKYGADIKAMANTYYFAGDVDGANELLELPQLAARLTTAYFKYRGRFDAEEYEILLIEENLKVRLSPGIISWGVADLVTRSRSTGRINLWEHKSTQNVPSDSVRLRDFQTLLYREKLRVIHNIIIDSVIWNYIRTKEPTEPDILKAGTVTKRKDLDTTWDVYAATVKKTGDNPESDFYREVRERLEGRELTTFFPRFEVPVVVDADVLIRDYVEEAKRTRTLRRLWEEGKKTPIMSLARDCDGCDYYLICKAILTGGDPEDVIRMKFTRGRSINYQAREGLEAVVTE